MLDPRQRAIRELLKLIGPEPVRFFTDAFRIVDGTAGLAMRTILQRTRPGARLRQPGTHCGGARNHQPPVRRAAYGVQRSPRLDGSAPMRRPRSSVLCKQARSALRAASPSNASRQ